MAKAKSDLPVLSFPSADAWRTWLAVQPVTSPGLWLKVAKKGSGATSVSRDDAIDGALCYGWIDGQLDKFDDTYWLIRFTPRKARSKWSDINRQRVARLIAEGRMKPGGLAEVDRAKADGRWSAAYAPQSAATVPDDLQIALARNPEAQRFFDRLDRVNRYAILYRIHDAKKPETRALRIEKYVAMLNRGETIYPVKTKP